MLPLPLVLSCLVVALLLPRGQGTFRPSHLTRSLAVVAPASLGSTTVSPPPPPPSSNGSGEEILAPARTRRPNPIQDFSLYTRGWNPTNVNYWASLFWSGIPAAFVGAVWLLVGLLALLALLLFWLCFRHHWRRWHSTDLKPLDWRWRAVLLSLGLAATLLAVSGFVMLTIGQVSLWGCAKSDMAKVVKTTGGVTDFVRGLSKLLLVGANASIGNIAVTQDQYMMLVSHAQQAVQIADSVDQQASWAQSQLDNFIDILAIIVVVVSSVFSFLILVAVGLAFWKIKWLSYLAVSLIWIFSVLSLCMLTITLDGYNFMGDTQVAMGQVEADPTASSAMDQFLPCTNQSLLNFTQVNVRAATYDLINLANAAWNASETGPVVIGPYNITEICNPFQGPPDYLPTREPCPLDLPTLSEIIQEVNATVCVQQPERCDSVKQQVQKAAFNVIVLAAALQLVYPEIGPIVNCRYVADLAQMLLEHMNKYSYNAYLAWVGYLLLSLGAMILCLLLPLYVFRRSRVAPAIQLTSLADVGARAFKGEQELPCGESESGGSPQHSVAGESPKG